MLTFTEEILLLLLDDEDGTFVPISKANLGCAIGGAVLMDLAFAYRIDTDPKALVVTDPAPTGNPMLDGTLAKIAAHGGESDTRAWIRVLAVEDAPAIREQALESLVARGIVQGREERGGGWGPPAPAAIPRSTATWSRRSSCGSARSCSPPTSPTRATSP